jgi:CRP-like cAMP-binding protein
MSLTPDALRTVPLFAGLADDHLQALAAVFSPLELAEGETLFHEGDEPTHFIVLARGEVTITHAGEPRFRLLPVAPIGELGSLAGVARRTSAVATAKSTVWRVERTALLRFFEQHGDVAFRFYHALLGIVADKIRRDELRMQAMRDNLVFTQKAMKALRDQVLEAEETPLSVDVVDQLEELIEHNRRGHYRVAPKHALATRVRRDDGVLVPVSEMSLDELHLPTGSLPGMAAGNEWSGVLVLPSVEIPVSGRVDRCDEHEVNIRLDPMIQEYARALGEHLTRVQMLDFVV